MELPMRTESPQTIEAGTGSDGMGSDGMGSDGMGADGVGADGVGGDTMTRRETLILTLRETFTDLKAEELDVLIERADSLEFGDGETIIRQGTYPDGIFVIVKGAVRVRFDAETNGSAGFSMEFSRLGAGNIFGEMSFLDQEGASANVVAQGDVDVLRIPTSAIDTISHIDYTFAGRFYQSLAKTLSRRLRAMNARIIGGMRQSVS